MDIILEHGSTEDNGLNVIDILQKKIFESDEKEENISDSSDSSKRIITKTKRKNQNKKLRKRNGQSEFSHSSDSENKRTNRHDFQEQDSSSSENDENLRNKNAFSSTLYTDRHIWNKNKHRNESLNRYNDGIILRSESNSQVYNIIF